MSTFSKWMAGICVVANVAFAQVILVQWSMITHLRQKSDMSQMAHQIEMSQIQDLQYQLEKLRTSEDGSKISGFISGVLDTIQRRDYYTDVWHAGYSRGTEVQQYANQVEKEAAKTAAYTKSEEVKD